jgi:hypothetical protein
MHLDCWNRAGRKGGHTMDRQGLVSRGEDVEVAVTVTAGEAVGGIARLGAWCGRDFRGEGGQAAGLRTVRAGAW